MAVEIKKTHVADKHLGIVNKIVQYNSYTTPIVVSDEDIELNGRTFRVLETNEAELTDYKRNEANTITTLKADEVDYVLDIEKMWAMQLDDLDVKDLNTDVEQYQVAKQTNKVVAPYIDQLRFATLIGNTNKNIIPVADKEYDAVLDASIELDELAISGTRYLFVTPTFYKGIKKRIVELPQGDRDNGVRYKGVVGELDGAIVVKVPNKILNNGATAENGVSAVLTVDSVLASPIQVEKFETGRLGAGRFGSYIQQLLYTGAFVLQTNQPKIVTISKKVPTAKKSGTAVTPKA